MYKIFDRRTCGLSHQIKGPTIVKLAKIGSCRKIASFTIVGPLIEYDNPQVRLWKILYINNNDFHNIGRSQMSAGACCYFRTSKPHSGTLWYIIYLCYYLFLFMGLSMKWWWSQIFWHSWFWCPTPYEPARSMVADFKSKENARKERNERT